MRDETSQSAMSVSRRMTFSFAAALSLMIPMIGTGTYAQDNPYHVEDGWAKAPEGRKLGSTSVVDVDRDGNIWAFERCGARDCTTSNLAPVFKFDPSGRVLTNFGAGISCSRTACMSTATGTCG